MIVCLCSNFLLVYSLNNSFSKVLKTIDSEAAKREVDTYMSLTLLESRIFTIMDTQMRILHYTIPHEKPIVGCPDCAEAFKQAEARQSGEIK